MSIDPFESVALRAGSPWNGLLTPNSESYSPPRDCESFVRCPAPTGSPITVPRLVPEVEEGNVEYKLRLLHPTPERFARLVTQLKWRLLAGSGQAYYELGVADSGVLVGLSRKHLEESLMTLEEMAGEIGASVIVVKEIELPPALFAAAQLQTQFDGVGALRMAKARSPGAPGDLELSLSTGGDSSTASDGDEEMELPTPEDRLPLVSVSSEGAWLYGSHPCTHSLQDSSFARTQASIGASRGADPDSEFADPLDYCDAKLKLEIATVYKPRPCRRRQASPDGPFMALGGTNTLSASHSQPMDIPPVEAGRRTKKANRQKRQSTLRSRRSKSVINTNCDETAIACTNIRALDELEEAAALFGAFSFDDELDTDAVSQPNCTIVAAEDEGAEMGFDVEVDDDVGFVRKGLASADAFHRGQLVVEDVTQKRFIVEALVVRKMSVDESSLDFLVI